MAAYFAPASADTSIKFTAETITTAELFDQSCFKDRILLGRGQIESIAWNKIPALLHLMNSYGNDGVFFQTTSKVQYVAITSGPSHTVAKAVDMRCAIASQQITVNEAVKILRARYNYPEPIELPDATGSSARMMIGSEGALIVVETANNWVILRRDRILSGVAANESGIRAEGRKFPKN